MNIKEKVTTIFVNFKEYTTYIKNDRKLLYKIPSRAYEEIRLNILYLFERIKEVLTGVSRFKKYSHSFHHMIADMQSADSIYRPSRLWENIYNQFTKVIYVNGLEQFKKERINRRFAALSPQENIFYTKFLWLYWTFLQEKDELHLLDRLEEPLIGGGEYVVFNNKRVTHDLLQSIDEFYSIYEYTGILKQNHPVILELGAGYGRLAYIFREAIPQSTYIISDLPNSLIISQYYLTQLYKHANILTYEKVRHMHKITLQELQKYQIVFIAPWDLEKIQPKIIDIFINIYSFQEMRIDAIQHYFSLIDKICRGIFYTKQYYISINPKDQIEITKEMYPVKKNWQEIYQRTTKVNPTVFEALYSIGS